MPDAFLKEVLRLYGGLCKRFSREEVNDAEIGNVKVKKRNCDVGVLGRECLE